MKSFTASAGSMELSWFNIYLADSLAVPPKDSNREIRERTVLLKWLILHVAEQSSSGHLRTDLRYLDREMAEWYSPEHTGSTTAKVDADEIPASLPADVMASLDSVLELAVNLGILGVLEGPDTTADSLEPPRPAMLLSSDRRYLYFLKRRREEDRFISFLEDRCRSGAGEGLSGLAMESGEEPAGELLQKIAEGRRLIILSGGPGTGKTSTVARLLKLLADGSAGGDESNHRIALAAPTGRAAARMGEALAGLSADHDTISGKTLHSLLGISPHRPPRYNRDEPLPAELVIVDEASMVDLPMMNNLLDALAPEAVLLLVGDPDQLPSVEAGAVLGDLLAENPAGSPLAGNVLRLTKVYRSDTAILEAAMAVRDGDIDRFQASCRADGVSVHTPAGPEQTAAGIAAFYRESCQRARGLENPDDELMAAYSSRGVLSPLRKGPWGVTAMNDRVSELLETTAPFAGMPIMVTGNDPARNLWNGDRGILLESRDRLRAWFKAVEGFRAFPLAVLPGWEPAWVQTIHKSQGSEFDEIVVLLPSGAERMLGREILYTALTRARHRVELHADPGVLEEALSRGVFRHSRIREWAATGLPHRE